jgi:Ubiquitin family
MRVITVRPTDLVFDVLKNSFEMEGIPIDEQILIYKGKFMNNKSGTIESWGLTNGSTLDLLLPHENCNRGGLYLGRVRSIAERVHPRQERVSGG